MARNPASGVRLPRASRDEPRFLSVPDLASLVREAGEGGLAICVLGFTGIRFGELTALRVARVNLGRRRLHVAESASEVGQAGLEQRQEPPGALGAGACRPGPSAGRGLRGQGASGTWCSPRPMARRCASAAVTLSVYAGPFGEDLDA